uniref:Uncharacterized protein n=1 Tax=Arundo donax TaxID=35708 RepID=A0A0A9A6H5_ARUDO
MLRQEPAAVDGDDRRGSALVDGEGRQAHRCTHGVEAELTVEGLDVGLAVEGDRAWRRRVTGVEREDSVQR